ncbi:GNAT family N-acetyltransferase [Acaryochloris sp. IP29b_bin.137]|uniref:GNAT family N-acetyltransferase n=1 Tax=Acaryochloris sp. IP29b_bin.137 TaxID=2969217 RepID=UPI00260E97CD|nr:GNAT family N-acetyltransferase [Acaryochloris sp. IP29b_bin.137]
MTTNSVFQKSWWLKALAPNQWEAIELFNQNGDVIARLPFVRKSHKGLMWVTMPPLTQTLGPWLAISSTKYSGQLTQQKELMIALIEQLPPCDCFSQNFHYSITNWLPFYWQGFTQTTRYTYVLEDLTDLEKIRSGFQSNLRGKIRKAKEQVAVRTDLGVEKFLDIQTLTYERQGLKLPHSRDLVRRLDQACVAQNARRIFFAEDSQGRIHAAVYIVWDQNAAYYLMGGGDPELRSSGAHSLALWEAIQFAATVTQRFDFEGSMQEPIERFFRGFGAKQMPYFAIRRESRRRQVVSAVRDFYQALT